MLPLPKQFVRVPLLRDYRSKPTVTFSVFWNAVWASLLCGTLPVCRRQNLVKFCVLLQSFFMGRINWFSILESDEMPFPKEPRRRFRGWGGLAPLLFRIKISVPGF